MSTPTITRARPVRTNALHVAADLLSQHLHLPLPTSVTVTSSGQLHMELTVDTHHQVDAWAEAMDIQVEHEPHPDGSWTDRATGELDVVTHNPYTRERIAVTVHSPQVLAWSVPHPHISASGKPEPCTHPDVCAADEAEFRQEVGL